MIYVSQGHERSIGPEIFIKSIQELSPELRRNFCFVCSQKVLLDHLKQMKIELDEFQGCGVNLAFVPEVGKTWSTSTLEHALQLMSGEQDVLLTLPTSKDQLFLNGANVAGYTEYLRKKYGRPDLAMTFMAPEDHVLLITDHIPLKAVSSTVTSALIVQKVSNVLQGAQKYFVPFQQVLVAGINPHAGENGILGHEDSEVTDAVNKLQKYFPEISFMGPLSGDTLHFHEHGKRPQLKVYMYHDQGLPVFKARHGVLGLNVTLGLPFLRMSVDHGTAFELFGKNCADHSGCSYLLQRALEVCQKMNKSAT